MILALLEHLQQSRLALESYSYQVKKYFLKTYSSSIDLTGSI